MSDTATPTLDKTFDFAAIEKAWYENWEQSGVFACQPQASEKTPYTIMMPPPNVTGSLHMGHALNHSLQDILIRFERMRGKDALWQPGTDHAGIATQMVVERQLDAEGKSRHDLGRDKFIERVWEWKQISGNTITTQLRRLGTSPDWARERFTMDEGLSDAVKKVFVQLYKDGLIYKDKRLVNWDPKLHTAISDLEVQQKESKSHLWHLRYPLADDPDTHIIVATTRPETMLGDTAVAVHPEDDRYKDLIGKHVKLPLVGRLIPIVADDYAEPETGSGAVKITPAHDFNDFEVGKRHGLEMINIFDKNAHINENAPEKYQGMERFAARKAVLADMEELGLLDSIEDRLNTVPYGDRSGVVIEPWLTDQWYVDAHTLAQPAIAAVKSGETEFVPKNWENTYFEWLNNIQPWCISRQLWWGHQIPAWYGPDGHIFVEESAVAAHAAAEKHYGAATTLTQDPDVLDTWFSSGLWPFSTLGWPEDTAELERYYATDVLVTGFDIIFFWVARMMMMGLHFMKKVPFKKVYIHALVRDEKGQKMSKSKGNIIDPLDLIGKYGADALRFTLTAMAAQGRDIKLAESRVAGYRNFATKLWNATRYAQMNGCFPVADYDPSGVSLQVNKWIIGELVKAIQGVTKGIEAMRFNEAASSIYQFAWGTFCDWYLEFTKPILQGDDESAKAEVRATTGYVIDQILHLLNPMMPFITEELYAKQADRAGARLIDGQWPVLPDSLIDAAAEDELNWAVRLISEIRSLRADMNVPAGAKLKLLLKDASEETLDRLARQSDIIERLARLESIAPLSNGIPSGAVQSVLDEATLILPLADVIDLDKEKARLQKEIGKLDKDVAFFSKKLKNEKFVANAAPEVVEEHREKLAAAEAAKAKLGQALTTLAG